MSCATPKSFAIFIDAQRPSAAVAAALAGRRSIRAYCAERPSLETVHAVLEAARWSPSGSNMQPWKVIAVAGEERAAVCRVARSRALSGASEEGSRPIHPPRLREEYRERRSYAAAQRLAALGIERSDTMAREAAILRNYDFFGAPVGLFFVTGRELGHGQWAHLGMFIQSVALAAWEFGLGTCIQEAWAKVRETLHRHFALASEDMIYCGMALGYADPEAPVNFFRSSREEVDDFATFRGFG